MKFTSTVFLLATGLLTPAVTVAQPMPLGAPFRVNAVADGAQNSPDVAADGADNFRFVWGTLVGEPTHFDVRTRRLQANGTLGADALLSETSTEDQASPAIDMNDAGDWVAIWTSDHVADGVDRLYGRFTTDGGTILGSEFQYNSDALTDGAVPSVANTGDGDLVGVWRNNADGNTIRGNARTRGGINFGVTAIAVGESNSWTGVAGLYGDYWVAAWHAPDADLSGVWVKCHDLSNPTETASHAAADGVGDQEYPDVASDGAFRFVVVWMEEFAIYARVFALSGNGECDPVSGEIPVSGPEGQAAYPRVDMATDGAFVVTWYSNGFDADNGVAAREFTKDGKPAGAPFPVHAELEGAQAVPAVATSATTFAVTWTTPDAGIGGPRDIQARRFLRRVVFTDSFESNDFTAWSASMTF